MRRSKVRGRIRTICGKMNRGRFPIGSRTALSPAAVRQRRIDLEQRREAKFQAEKEILLRVEIQRMEARKRKEGTLGHSETPVT